MTFYQSKNMSVLDHILNFSLSLRLPGIPPTFVPNFKDSEENININTSKTTESQYEE